MENVNNLIQSKILKYFFVALLGSIILAVSAKIKIPFYPVPMTMQTFVVLIIGIAFGWKLGIATITLYLFEGIIGLPVFSGTPEKGIGLIYFIGPTMGYLIGFLVAVYLTGKFDYGSNLLFNFLKLLFATSFIYLFGIIWLGKILGWDKPLFELGVQPFLLAEFCKVLLATVLINQIKKFKKKFN